MSEEMVTVPLSELQAVQESLHNVKRHTDSFRSEYEAAVANVMAELATLREQRDRLLLLLRQAVTDSVCFCDDRIACGGDAPCWQCRVRSALAEGGTP